MENETIENYLEDVCSYIKNKDVHIEISDEIREHIYEIIDEYTYEGLSEAEAITKAIQRLGSAYDCGMKLNKIHKAKPDIITIVLALALGSIGIFTMYSIENNGISNNASYFNNIVGLITGGIIGIGTYLFDYRKLKRYSYHLYWLTIIILIIIFLKADSFFNIEFGRFSDNQASFHIAVTILLLISLSGVINIKNINNKKDLIFIVAMACIPVILLLASSDVTVGLIYFCGINMIILTSKIHKSLKINLLCGEVVVIFIALFILLLNKPYRIARLHSLINPTLDPKGDGYTITTIRSLLSQATLYGNEVNREAFKIGSLKSNFTLVYIIYNFGIAFGGICIAMIMAFVVRIFSIIGKVKDSYGKTLILVMGYMFLMQVIINMLSNLGIVGVYISLPFICFGCINSVISGYMVGLICSIYRRRNVRYQNV